jgi:hypothetical protein
MIKNFNKFCESVSLNFEESEESDNIKDKLKIPDDVIRDYFIELTDEGCELSTICKISSILNGVKLYYNVTITKNIQNPQSKYSISNQDYLKYMNEQINFINTFNSCVDRFSQAEDLEIKFNNIIGVPFWGAGNNNTEFGILSQTIAFNQEIETDEYKKAKKEFNEKDNPLRKSVDSVINRLRKEGVKEAEQLIDVQNADTHWMIGFMTDDEILVIATWDEEGLIYDEHDLSMAIDSYNRGDCDEYLGKK